MNLVIIAGGKGTRLGIKDMSKPMVEVGGKPLLEHHINLAKQYAIKNIYMLSGYLSEVIVDYFGDGIKFGVKITHIIEKSPLGTAGAVKQLESRLDESFMVFYGDVFLDIDLKSFMDFDRKAHSIASIIVHPNDHPYDSDLVDVNDENIVTAFYSKPHDENQYHRNLVNAAVYILRPDIFEYIPQDKPSDFGKDIFPLVLQSNKVIRAYKTAEYITDIGTIERLKRVRRDITSGKVKRFSKQYKRPAIFIDRDGTIVRDVDLLHRVEDLELFPFSTLAIKKINSSDYLSFLITNQPIVARNLCDISMVAQIHNKLETILGREGAYLNDIYFCPHHPDKGYIEENPDLKVDCDCRKPKTGMISEAVKEYNVDIESSWFIGDTTTDIQTGINAGLKTILLRSGKGGRDEKYQCQPDFFLDDLSSAVDFILTNKDRYDVYIKKITDTISKNKSRIPLIISVAGLARSGKSTFIKLLMQKMQRENISSQSISLDNWIIDVNLRTDDMTIRERYKYGEIVKDITKLINEGKIILRKYNTYFRKTDEVGYYALNNSICLIIDGIPSLDIEELRDISDIKIYLEIDENIRKKRFFKFYKWKDISDEKIEHLYLKRLKDEVPFIKESKKYADIIVEA